MDSIKIFYDSLLIPAKCCFAGDTMVVHSHATTFVEYLFSFGVGIFFPLFFLWLFYPQLKQFVLKEKK